MAHGTWHMPRLAKPAAPLPHVLISMCSLPFLSGCLERTVTVTSEPPGALVTLNGVEVGRTPTTTAFTYYGTYDVRLKRDGYEPVWEPRKAAAPIYEYPPLDLAAAAAPVNIRTRLTWHFDLKPMEAADTPGGEQALIERARELRERSGRSE
jgi:hypothetical protein